jgi:hypothetical protein
MTADSTVGFPDIGPIRIVSQLKENALRSGVTSAGEDNFIPRGERGTFVS